MECVASDTYIYIIIFCALQRLSSLLVFFLLFLVFLVLGLVSPRLVLGLVMMLLLLLLLVALFPVILVSSLILIAPFLFSTAFLTTADTLLVGLRMFLCIDRVNRDAVSNFEEG